MTPLPTSGPSPDFPFVPPSLPRNKDPQPRIIYGILKENSYITQKTVNMAPHADGNTVDTNGSTLKPTAPTFQPSSAALAESRYHSTSTASAIEAEDKYAAHNYHPLPIVFARAQGSSVWDPEGKHYIDCLSAYSAVNQGHCHPELVKALCEQAQRLTLSSRAFHNDVFPKWAEKVKDVFGYDMVLPMNTGAEAVETAIKIARKWAYKVKGVPQNKALVFAATENFHGRTVRI
jgi:ornithine--oxo-acid transaminase